MQTDEQLAIEQFKNRESLPFSSVCGCMGPRDGEPLCPCAMKYTEKVNGKLFRITYTNPFKDMKATEIVPEKHTVPTKKEMIKERIEKMKNKGG